MKEKKFCKRADKPCRTQAEAEIKAHNSLQYRRAYKCEFCNQWHITSRLRREDEIFEEKQEIDVD